LVINKKNWMLGKYLRNLRLKLETSQMGYTVFKEKKTLHALYWMSDHLEIVYWMQR
jgi:hypothetical protein